MHLTKIQIRDYLFGYIAIIVMVAVSAHFRTERIILPEFAVMSAGMLALREMNWIKQPHKIVATPVMTALVGYLVNLLPLAYIFKIGLVLFLMLVLLKLTRSRLAPAFATGLLPIITDAHHWTFILIIILLTGILLVGVLIHGSHKRISFELKPISSVAVWQYIWITAIWMLLVHGLGQDIMVGIPPVSVLLLEAVQQVKYPSYMWGKHVLALTLAATLGVLGVTLTNNWALDMAITLPAIFGLLQIMKLELPAVYAFPPLVLILPKAMLPNLVLYTALASGVMLGCVFIIKQYKVMRS